MESIFIGLPLIMSMTKSSLKIQNEQHSEAVNGRTVMTKRKKTNRKNGRKYIPQKTKDWTTRTYWNVKWTQVVIELHELTKMWSERRRYWTTRTYWNVELTQVVIELHELTKMWSERRWWLNYTNLLKCGVNTGGDWTTRTY